MTAANRKAIAAIRKQLGMKRLDPRSLYIVDDGAYRWIGCRAELNAADARLLARVDFEGRRPDLAGAAQVSADDYSEACGRSPCVAASHNSAGVVKWADLPESWRGGGALGPISPL